MRNRTFLTCLGIFLLAAFGIPLLPFRVEAQPSHGGTITRVRPVVDGNVAVYDGITGFFIEDSGIVASMIQTNATTVYWAENASGTITNLNTNGVSVSGDLGVVGNVRAEVGSNYSWLRGYGDMTLHAEQPQIKFSDRSAAAVDYRIFVDADDFAIQLLNGSQTAMLVQDSTTNVVFPDYALVVHNDQSFAVTSDAIPAAATNSVTFFATNNTAAELWVIDGSGNVTAVSPHDGLKHVADSYNVWTGEGHTIDLVALAKAVEALNGQAGSIVTDYTIPRRDWDVEEQKKVNGSVNSRASWAKEKEDNAKAWDKHVADELVGIPSTEPEAFTKKEPMLYKKAAKLQWLKDWEDAQ